MRKASFFLLFIIGSVNSIAQTNPDTLKFSKAADGSEYKLYTSAAGIKLANGNFMELNVTATYKDSLLFSTYVDGMPQFGLYDTAQFPSPFKESFNNIYLHDSVVIRLSTDSIMAKGQVAPFMQPGEFIYQTYRISAVFTTKEQTDSAQQSHMLVAKEKASKRQVEQIQQNLANNKELIAAENKLIEAELAKKKLKAIKTNWGTYVVIKKEGIGKKLVPGNIATVNYTGKFFKTGKPFDSNTDPKFQHVSPYDVPVGQLSGIIAGWPDALKEMKKGTIATLYIPSALAYGKAGRQPLIQPDEILVFDMNVVKVSNEPGFNPGPEVEEKKVVVPQPKAKPAVKAKPVKTIVKPQVKKTNK